MKHPKLFRTILTTAFLAVFACLDASAQFKEDAFTQQYNDDPASAADSTDVLFSFKDYFGGLRHRNEIKIGTMTAGSALFIGGSQIYNRQAWKLPIVYGTIGGSLGAGLALNAKGNRQAATYCFIGAGVAYWATLMDGVINYRPNDYPHPGTATLYSLLLPGLGQIYNHDYWKVPIYWGCLVGAYHYWALNKRNYLKYKNIYLDATSGGEYKGPFSAETALYYRDIFRRYRDYSVLAIAGFYLIQVIDANVFSYMNDFEVNDDISLHIKPTLITPDVQFASRPVNAVGVSLGFTF